MAGDGLGGKSLLRKIRRPRHVRSSKRMAGIRRVSVPTASSRWRVLPNCHQTQDNLSPFNRLRYWRNMNDIKKAIEDLSLEERLELMKCVEPLRR